METDLGTRRANCSPQRAEGPGLLSPVSPEGGSVLVPWGSSAEGEAPRGGERAAQNGRIARDTGSGLVGEEEGDGKGIEKLSAYSGTRGRTVLSG